MMLKNFNQVLTQVRRLPRTRVSVANAQDEIVLSALKKAVSEGFVQPVLVGNGSEIRRIADSLDFDLKDIEVRDVQESEVAEVAVKLVRYGDCRVLMKGMINTSVFLRAVLNVEWGLRAGGMLSHLAIYQISGYDRLIFITDGGLTVSPNLEQKKMICQNAVDFVRSLGVVMPKVAVLSANEQVSPKMPVTLDAQQLTQMAKKGEISGAIVEGPLALDLAINEKALRHKGIKSSVAAKADILLVPNIEAGNILGKSIMYFAHGIMAGVVLGACAPVVLTSRADSSQGKLVSLAFACLAGFRGECNMASNNA